MAWLRIVAKARKHNGVVWHASAFSPFRERWNSWRWFFTFEVIAWYTGINDHSDPKTHPPPTGLRQYLRKLPSLFIQTIHANHPIAHSLPTSNRIRHKTPTYNPSTPLEQALSSFYSFLSSILIDSVLTTFHLTPKIDRTNILHHHLHASCFYRLDAKTIYWGKRLR